MGQTNVPRIFAIRTDASPAIGSGHIRRMTILAGYLRERGLVPVLLCRAGTSEVLPDLDAVFECKHEITSEDEGPEILRKSYGESVAGVFFDHYALSADTHRLYRAVSPFVAGIDDMADRPLDFDLLFDVNLGRGAEAYDGLVPQDAEVLVGSRFQIINPAFFDIQESCLSARRERAGALNHILIAMGGTDPFGFTTKALDTAAEVLPDCKIDVVAGALSPNLDTLRSRAAQLGDKVALHIETRDVATLMCRADLAIGAGGTMTWERNCLGLPSIVLVIADNQEMVGLEMAKAKAAIVLEAKNGYPAAEVRKALTDLQNDRHKLMSLVENTTRLSGENGAQLAAKIISQRVCQNRDYPTKRIP